MTKETEQKTLNKFVQILENRANVNKPISFWWRDDDAFQPSKNLDRLIELSDRRKVPFALAVIPKNADESLARKLQNKPNISVLLHGYSHRNHAGDSEKERASEFGDNRPVKDCLHDLNLGFKKLNSLFGKQTLPVLAPPWNRIGIDCLNRIGEVGLRGYSRFGELTPIANDSHHADVHWDPIEWGEVPKFCGANKAWNKLVDEVKRRNGIVNAPIGLMTHHLVHDEGVWKFMDDLLELLTSHPGAAFPTIKEIFGFH